MKELLIINTGGTIVMENNIKGCKTSNRVLQEILNELEIKIEPSFYFFNPLIDSSQLSFKHLNKLFKILRENENKYLGFIIVHGTDTMAYTYRYLKEIFRSFSRPIALVGSMSTRDRDREEGINSFRGAINFLNSSLGIALSIGEDLITSDIIYKELCGKGWKFKGRNSIINIKNNIRNIVLGYIDIEVIEVTPIMQYNEEDLAECLLLKVYGSGTIPANRILYNRIIDYLRINKDVIVISQIPGGILDFSLYEASQILRDERIIVGSGMTFESAIVHLHILKEIRRINE